MAVSVADQARALLGAIGLGTAAGLLYDLFRVLRVRIPLRWLGSALLAVLHHHFFPVVSGQRRGAGACLHRHRRPHRRLGLLRPALLPPAAHLLPFRYHFYQSFGGHPAPVGDILPIGEKFF